MFTISQFAERLGISADTLRYYEKEGLLAPQRNASGYRVYSGRDEAWFGFVKRLKDTGMPMAQRRVAPSGRCHNRRTLRHARSAPAGVGRKTARVGGTPSAFGRQNPPLRRAAAKTKSDGLNRLNKPHIISRLAAPALQAV